MVYSSFALTKFFASLAVNALSQTLYLEMTIVSDGFQDLHRWLAKLGSMKAMSKVSISTRYGE